MSKGSVLVVEDENAVASFTRSCLERMGYEVVAVAPTGEDALQWAAACSPDLVLMDISLRGRINGVEAARQLWFDLKIPVIYTTGAADQETFERAKSTEPIGFVLKPFDFGMLRTTVETAMHHHRTSAARSENAIQEANQKYRSIFDNAMEGIFQSTPTGRLLTANPAMARILGFGSVDDLIRDVQDVSVELSADPDCREKFVRRLELQGIARNFEARFRRRDGKEICALINARAVKDSAGKTVYYEGMASDVTDLRQAALALRAREATLRAITTSARDAIIMMDDQGAISFWNPAAQRILGWSEEEVLGKNLHDLLAPERCRRSHAEAFPRFREAGGGAAMGRTLELWALRKDGAEIPIELSLAAVQLDGRWNSISIVRDISERKRSEEERERLGVMLRQAQKLEAVGQLAAGIAHEINTPTQYVGDNTRFLKDAFNDLQKALRAYARLLEAGSTGAVPDDLVRSVEEAVQAADLDYLSGEIPLAIDQTLEGVERVATIVRAMKEFSHPGTHEKIPTDINKAISSTLIVCRNEYKYVADLETDFDESLPLVPCLPGDFNQVMLNLLVNAAHAIKAVLGPEPEGKGRITVSTRSNEGWAEVRISDTGCGIPPEIRSRIFDPFFTTKEVGKGTGQGLAIAHAVVVGKHAGTIDFESEVAKGTTFIIRLPLDIGVGPEQTQSIE